MTLVVGGFGPDSAGRGTAGAGASEASGGVADPDASRAGRGADVESSIAGAPAPASQPMDVPPTPVTPNPPDVVVVDTTPRATFCIGSGLPLRTQRPSSSPADCGANLARKLFSYAVCSCEDLGLPRTSFTVDGFDSRKGGYQPGQGGASVGVHRSLTQIASDTQVFGSMVVTGANPIQLGSSRFSVIGDLKTNAALEVSVPGARIVRDLWVAGDIRGPKGSISVGRDAHHGVGRAGGDVLTVGGRSYTANSVNVQPPCACDDPLDIPKLVAQARTTNDNTDAAWSPSQLHIGPFLTQEMVLPCGRLYVDDITLDAPSTYNLAFASRTALFVAGDFTVHGLATFAISRYGLTGELDIFVAGNLVVEGTSTLSFTNSSNPSAVRIYVGGQVTVSASAVFGLAAQLYAPHATLDLPTQLTPEAYGSISAASIRQLGFPKVHYDRAVQALGSECAARVPQRCDACYQCAEGLACVVGSCGPCESDADCCGSSICVSGRCDAFQP